MLNQYEMKSLAFNGFVAAMAVVAITLYEPMLFFVTLYAYFMFGVAVSAFFSLRTAKIDPDELSRESQDAQKRLREALISGVSRKKYGEAYLFLDLIIDGMIAICLAFAGLVLPALFFTGHIWIMQKNAKELRQIEAATEKDGEAS